MNYGGLVFAAAGVFALVCAAMNFDWFMEHRRARLLVKALSRTGARIFYGALGLALIAFGALNFLGVIA